MSTRARPTVFGSELRRWRQIRRFSQEELAMRADVSQRHLSYLENGRTKPSSEMVQHLAATLDVPLRARNGLLTAAGFAPAFSEEPIDGERLSHIRSLLATLVEAHEPFPAFVVNRHWDLILSNTSAASFTGALIDPTHALDLGGNVLRIFLHPNGIREHVANWPDAAAVMLRRLRAECDHHPGDLELRALLDEVLTYEGVAALSAEPAAEHDLLVDLEIQLPDGPTLRFYTTLTTLSDATDITVSELALETFLPADPATLAVLTNAS